MFKKILALLICVACVNTCFSAVAYAETGETSRTRIICSGDVEKISIEIIPAEPYYETMGVYVIADEMSFEDITPDNVFDLIIAIKEINAVDGKYSAVLNLREGIEPGWYKVVVTDYLYKAPLWNETDIEQRSARFYLADMNLVDAALEALNDATKNNINSLIVNDYNNVLNIEIPEDYDQIKDKLAEYLVLERKYTYSNSFETVDEVKAAYAVATLCARIATGEKADLKALINSDVEKFLTGFVDDFTEFEAEAIRVFEKIRDKEDDNKRPHEVIGGLLRQATAVAALNMSSRADVPQIIDEYNDVLKLDLDGKFLKVNETEVYKALSRMAFDSVEDVQNAFDARIEQLLDKKQSSGSGGGGGGSSFGGGKSEYKFTDNEKTESVKPSDSAFSDMYQADWAKEYVEYLVERKIVNGDGTGNFKPNARITREEFVKMIVLALDLYDEDAKAVFDDVNENEWYYPYIASAVKCGIIRGVDEKNFGVGKNITRQDIAVIANRVYGINGKAVEITKNAQQFADYDAIADYAKESVVAMRDAGIINGFEDNTFMPADFATRAQAAKIIYVLIEEVIGL